MEIKPIEKPIERTIAASKNLRLKYGDCRTFDLLKIQINYEGKAYIFEIDAAHLRTDRDSIHVTPIFENGEIKFQFTGWVEPYVRFVSCH